MPATDSSVLRDVDVVVDADACELDRAPATVTPGEIVSRIEFNERDALDVPGPMAAVQRRTLDAGQRFLQFIRQPAAASR